MSTSLNKEPSTEPSTDPGAGPRVATRTAELQRQGLDELSGASLRALAGDSALHYRSTHLYHANQRQKTQAPHLQLAQDAPEQNHPATRRALVDAVALRLTRSDPNLYRSLAPPAAIERLIFDWLEQLRVESLTADSLPGQKGNLRKRFEHWSSQFQHSGELETVIGLLLFSLCQVCWSRLQALPLDDEITDRIEGVRARMAPILGSSFAALRKLSNNQQDYAQPALKIAAWVALQIRAELEVQSEARKLREEEGAAQVRAAFSILLDLDQDQEERGLRTTPSGHSKVFEDSAGSYRMFSRAFDLEVQASELLREEQLKEYRDKLDGLVAATGINVFRLAKQLQAVLAKPLRDGWDFGQEEGLIDGRRLSQLLSSPSERRIFKTERTPPRSNAQLTLLIDCSGSMKAHMETVAVLSDLFARALDMAGVSNEVLGFTTGAWNGGRTRTAWTKAGQAPNPGRLNELKHIVFKPADKRWRQARGPMGALFKPEIFREGIDGEAIEWACTRLLRGEHERRILVVISDGCPMDTATAQTNDRFYLDNHLRQVIEAQEKKGQVEILGLGVGLDLSVYYKRCMGIDSDRKVDTALLDKLVRMIENRHGLRLSKFSSS